MLLFGGEVEEIDELYGVHDSCFSDTAILLPNEDVSGFLVIFVFSDWDGEFIGEGDKEWFFAELKIGWWFDFDVIENFIDWLLGIVEYFD